VGELTTRVFKIARILKRTFLLSEAVRDRTSLRTPSLVICITALPQPHDPRVSRHSD
jgi:hypothetical protein